MPDPLPIMFKSGTVIPGKRVTLWNPDSFLEPPVSNSYPRHVQLTTDLFSPDVPFDAVDRAFAQMALSKQHTFMVPTEHPARMAEYMTTRRSAGGMTFLDPGLAPVGVTDDEAERWRKPVSWPLLNVILGTIIHDQQTADERVPDVLKCPAAMRFLYCVLRGPVDLSRIDTEKDVYVDPLRGEYTLWCDEGIDHPAAEQTFDGGPKIDWLIAAGGDQPCHPEWLRSIRDQCQAASVPFWFVGWGAWVPVEDGSLHEGDKCVPLTAECDPMAYPSQVMRRVGASAAGRLLDGRTHDDFPEGRKC